MIYDENEKVFHLSGREFILTARSGIAESLPLDEEVPALSLLPRAVLSEAFGQYDEEKCVLKTEVGGHVFAVHLSLLRAPDGTLLFGAKAVRNPEKPTKEELSFLRGDAFLCAFAEYEKTGVVPALSLLFYCEAKDAYAIRTETPKPEALTAFIDKCKTVLVRYCAPAIHRAEVRLPSFRKMKFPFPKIREGQDVFMQGVYRAAAHGTNLYAEAPTGIGKTVSALFPALRAVGDGKGEKVFYFTPKSTIARVAEATVKRMCENGADVLSVTVSAKEKICFCHLCCRDGKDACTYSSFNRIADAAFALFDAHLPVADAAVLSDFARRFSVCPYELSLAYAQLCDVVICDVNYLFDPTVYFHRFFEGGGDYIFLVDEAHNLPARASDMYSDELSDADFAPVELPEHSALVPALLKAKAALSDLVFRYLKDDTTVRDGIPVGAGHGKELPGGLFALLNELLGVAEEELLRAYGDKTEGGTARRHAVKALYYRFFNFRKIAGFFDGGYEWFMFREGEGFRLKLFAVDPSARIAERLEKGRCAVFFSATLSPLSYYKSLLGGGRADEALTLPSPFVKEQLSVLVADGISTKLADRERTLPAVMKLIAATLSAKRGHYLVFAPSFSYLEMLEKFFRQKYPKIRTVAQTRSMSADERRAFLSAFSDEPDGYLVGFAVTGGVFAEGIDLVGKSLIGSVIVGVGLPEVSFEREAMSAYFEEKYEAGKAYAYVFPGMNKVLQAGGRVIREEEDRGVILLIDDRLSDPVYKRAVPTLWHGLKFCNDAATVKKIFEEFWLAEAASETT